MSHADLVALALQLFARNLGQEKIIKLQQAKIKGQDAKITAQKVSLSKDSLNSSKSPSSDGLKKRIVVTRKKSTKKPGGQEKHPGVTLRKSARVDRTVENPLPKSCGNCGRSLADVHGTRAKETRQVIDLPAIRYEVIEHVILVCECPDCDAPNRGSFPPGVVSAVQYSPAVHGTAVYLNQEQLLPFKRTANAMRDLFGIKLSPGSIYNYRQKAGALLTPEVAAIVEVIVNAPVAHFDESGARYDKKLYWLHVASTSTHTWYGVHAKRGHEAMTHFNILPRFKGIAVHDGWKSYQVYDCVHALCNAHHLRELQGIHENTGQQWASDMMALLRTAKKDVDAAKAESRPLADQRIREIDDEFHYLLGRGAADNPEQLPQFGTKRRVKQSDGYNLMMRLFQFAADALRFTTDPNAPFDNNQAERDIRMEKLRQKISGCFRSLDGMAAFCTIRSYLSTLRKQQRDIYQALVKTFEGNAPSAV